MLNDPAKFYFAPSTRGFYIDAQARPEDAVEITQAQHAEFLGVLNAGGSVQTIDGELVAVPRGVSFADQQADKLRLIDAKANDLLNGGYATGGLHVSLTDASRADLTAMATTAGFAVSGVVPWPESYQLGWISIENVRIPLPTPEEGILLAAAIGDFYARIKQHARSLKDAVTLAEDADGLVAIDIESGWPQ
ncbi:DUF4376 domain-containing protein [Rhizobium sp. SL86]|uniref:DUF4376 domain-containing protein n=1 Tax=Rhizobium sp. SL86 TaxID=2995148 RepID=UPI0022738910|nr:hypothetical protein [Rhizobium sp. SL86]MCY1668310.1 hypothetical protein [Rhizobium sp. SL86]